MATKSYRVNWRIKGLTKKPLLPGQTVQLDESAAKRCLEVGSLTLIESTVIVDAPEDPPDDLDAILGPADSAAASKKDPVQDKKKMQRRGPGKK